MHMLCHLFCSQDATVFFAGKALGVFVTSLFLALILGRYFVRFSKYYFTSSVREHTPQSHKQKNFTPTMGGAFVLVAIVLSLFIWRVGVDKKMLSLLVVLFGYGMIGAWDDWCKIAKKKGISAFSKSMWQIIIAGIALALWIMGDPHATILSFYNVRYDLGWLFIPWALFVIVGCSNAVNLTDGLDGLAAVSLIFNYAAFALLFFVQPFFCADLYLYSLACVGAISGFLWYNTYPAQIFMGDIGSLSLGGSLAMLALLTKQEFLLCITGGLFVMETVSVIAQVFSMKVFKSRVFKMAPLHHHFELKGWHECTIVMRFSLITGFLCLTAFLIAYWMYKG